MVDKYFIYYSFLLSNIIIFIRRMQSNDEGILILNAGNEVIE